MKTLVVYSCHQVELADNSLTTLADNASQSIADIVAKEVGSIGENIKASRAVCLTIENNDQHLAHYLHNAGETKGYYNVLIVNLKVNYHLLKI